MTVGTKNRDQDSNVKNSYLLSRAKNSGRQCHFKIWLHCHEFKKKSLPDYAHVNKVSKNELINVN
jgi:hypothetical protein